MKPIRHRPTVREVAHLAGVGTMTVSRVVNRQGYVSEKTRSRVESAIATLGYIPNQQARGLRTKQTRAIALIVSDITNPFFTTMVQGVEEAARKAGYVVLLSNSNESAATEDEAVRLLVAKGVDGVLLVPASHPKDLLTFLSSHHVPAVVLDRKVSDGTDGVRCDPREAVQTLARILTESGHRRFAVLAGPDDLSTSNERVSIFAREAQAAGAQICVWHGPMTVVEGARLALNAVASDFKPTAIFAVNNFLSIGALNALTKQGFRIPEDLSLVGFDDLPETLLTFPFLTIASQAAYDLGKVGFERLLLRIATPDRPCEEILLPTSVILRHSIGRAH